jgi:uncharacterized membrane protein YbhN (UPF0104 family)
VYAKEGDKPVSDRNIDILEDRPSAWSEERPLSTANPSPGLPEVRQAPRRKGVPFLRWRSDPSIVVTLVISLGMVGYVAYLASARQSSEIILTIVQRTWLPVLILIFPYLAARLLVWYELLCQLGIVVPRRQLVVAFAAGEATKALPAGVYLQNYLLSKLSHLNRHSVVRSTTATTAMLGLESAVAVPVAVIVGIPREPWVRFTILGIVVAWIVVLFLAWLLVRYRARHMSPRTAAWRRRLIQIIDEFLTAGGELISIRTVRTIVPTAVYMLIYVLILYAVIQAAGAHQITFVDAMSIYAITVLAVIMVPIPTEIGITEFTGLGALLAYGLPSATAAAVMVSFRILSTGATLLVAGALLVGLRRELASAKST